MVDEKTPAALLSVEGVEQYYGGSHILRDVGFEARAGQVTVVLGRNGVGKSTLLKSLVGTVPVRTGRVVLGWDGHEAPAQPRARAPRRGLRAPGARDLRPPDGRREPAHGAGDTQRRHGDSRRTVRTLSGARQDAAPARRRSLGWPAAATRHRPRHRGRPEAAAGSTSRPKASSPASSRRSAASSAAWPNAARWPSCSSSSSTTSPPNSPTSYIVMQRGAIVQRGRGENMHAEGARALIAI